MDRKNVEKEVKDFLKENKLTEAFDAFFADTKVIERIKSKFQFIKETTEELYGNVPVELAEVATEAKESMDEYSEELFMSDVFLNYKLNHIVDINKALEILPFEDKMKPVILGVIEDEISNVTDKSLEDFDMLLNRMANDLLAGFMGDIYTEHVLESLPEGVSDFVRMLSEFGAVIPATAFGFGNDTSEERDAKEE